MDDTFKHQGLRNILVQNIRKKGIVNNRVLDAIGRIPRHLFMDNAFINFSYEDKAFPIGSGQTISQPYTVAFQTDLLDIKPYDKILEIGTGSGYQSAVLLELDAIVYTIERQKELYNRTKKFLPKIGYSCNFFYGDGYNGLPTLSPFDKIIITCGAPEIPVVLIEQLKVGGRLVAPIGDSNVQEMKLLEKLSEAKHDITNHGHFSFVPMLTDRS